jgi:hypothetical protein
LFDPAIGRDAQRFFFDAFQSVLQDVRLASVHQRAQAPLERAIDCCAHRQLGQLELDAAEQDVAKQREIPQQAVPRMLERRGTILLEHEMTEPREPISTERRCEQQPRIPREHCQHEHDHDERRPDEVQATAGTIAVLGQIERIKIREPLKAISTHGGRGLNHIGAGSARKVGSASFPSAIKDVKRMLESRLEYRCSGEA